MEHNCKMVAQVKIKNYSCPVHATKAHREVKVQLHSIWTSVLK